MNREIAHRGPDGAGVFIDYPLCFGHLRLSIIDLSIEANQPMFNEDRSIVIIYNGEIYNYLELIPELKCKGHVFRTRSDTEVILHAYEEYGFDCVKRFNGMWAFAIYDFRKKTLFASRDRFGVKPFYYFIDDKQFIFSSEIKAILTVNKINEANHGKVYDYLAYGYKTNNGDTFFKNIFELKPSHNLIIEDDKTSFEKYWDIDQHKTKIDKPGAQIKDMMYDAVKLRYRSDVPVSILLSGGLDSTIITKITDELIDVGELKNDNVSAFSAVFPGFIFDESESINEFVNSCKHIRSFQINTGHENLIQYIDDFVYGMGEPVFGTTSFAHYILMKEIKKFNVKVVLNGQGSDEMWCGYDKYFIGYFLLDHLLSNPIKFFAEMNSISKKMKFSHKYIFTQIIKAALPRRYASYLRAKHMEKVTPCLSEDFVNNNYNYFSNPGYSKLLPSNLSSFMKYNIDYQGFNQILHYEDHSAMQNSIEIRSPFIDYRLAEMAFSVSDKLKMQNGITKKILREIFSNKLPDSIVNSRNKIGFVTPFENWLDKLSKNGYVKSILNSESFKEKTIFNSTKINNVFSNREAYKDFPYWRIINLELWSRLYNIKNL